MLCLDKTEPQYVVLIVAVEKSITTGCGRGYMSNMRDWEDAIAEAENIEDFNKLLPLARERGNWEVRFIHEEAIRRGYVPNRDRKCYEESHGSKSI